MLQEKEPEEERTRRALKKNDLHFLKKRFEEGLDQTNFSINIGEARSVRSALWTALACTGSLIILILLIAVTSVNGFYNGSLFALIILLGGTVLTWIRYIHSKHQEDLLHVIECIEAFHLEQTGKQVNDTG